MDLIDFKKINLKKMDLDTVGKVTEKLSKRVMRYDFLHKLFIGMIFLALVLFIRTNNKEGFANTITYNSNNINNSDMDNYPELYDNVVIDREKNNYVIDEILKRVETSENSKVLDIECKTGSTIDLMREKIGSRGECYGVDRSHAMINLAEANYPETKFIVGDINDNNLLRNGIFTHILCLNMAIYYIKDKRQFFMNCRDLLSTGGYLVVHLVDKNKFNSVATSTRLTPFVNPNNHDIKRINNSIIQYNDIVYKTRFKIFPNDLTSPSSVPEMAEFRETITDKSTGNVTENIHNLYMPNQIDILQIAKLQGFKFVDVIELRLKDTKNEFVYILQKQ